MYLDTIAFDVLAKDCLDSTTHARATILLANLSRKLLRISNIRRFIL